MIGKKRGFTLIELLVVIAIIAILMAILIPTLHRAKEQGKRAACLNNLRQMALAWNLYADDFEGKMVNGCTSLGTQNRDGTCWAYWAGRSATEEARLDGIRDGLLYRYCPEVQLYKCPTGIRGEVVTYAIPDSMNGHYYIPGAQEQIKTLRSQIRRPTEQIIFLDEGRLSPSSWTIWYDQERWWDQITARGKTRARWRWPRWSTISGKTPGATAGSPRNRATRTCTACSAASSASWGTNPAASKRSRRGAGEFNLRRRPRSSGRRPRTSGRRNAPSGVPRVGRRGPRSSWR